MFRTNRVNARRATCFLLTAALVAFASTTAATAGAGGQGKKKVPGKAVTEDDLKRAKSTPIEEIIRKSKPLAIEEHGGGNGAEKKEEGPDGPELTIEGTESVLSAFSSLRSTSLLAATQNGAWPGGYSANPNRQIGKLYFWTGTRWSHCTATAINSENKSLVLTAGHCVYNPDPDNNGRVDGNGTWYTNVHFCPGYESGCKLGIWYSRQLYTTNTWFYGSGTSKSYDWTDDIGIVLVSSNSANGLLVNAVGGQGITFNLPTGRQRYAFGYPASDSRWPEYSYSGEDLMYCPAVDVPDNLGHLKIACTMTGGASGGPWLTNVGSNWMGYVNSVNSHKAWGGPYMGGPYFSTAESDVFQYARAR